MKTKNQKRAISTLLALTLTFGSLAPQNKAHAVVGIVTSNPIVSLVGLGTALGGALLWSSPRNSMDFERTVYGFYGVVLGVIVLDENTLSAPPQFQSLSTEVVKKAGLTHQEQMAFENSIPELNAVLESVSSELNLIENVDEQTAATVWKSALASIDVDTTRALKKVMLSQ